MKKGKHKRTFIHDNLYRLTWFVQRGGSEQDAVNWYTDKMKAERHILNDSNRQGHFTHIKGERDALLWFRQDAGTGTICHEVMHALVHLSQQLDIEIGPETEELFAYYAGWLTQQIVKKLWY